MNKNIKTITKILITILIVIGILLILPKDSIGFSINRNTQVNGNVTEHVRNSETLKDGDVFSKSRVYYTGKDNNFKTLQELIDGASLKVVEGHVFENNFVFCIEHGQNLNAGGTGVDTSTYGIDYKVTFDGNEIKRYDREGTLKATYKTSSDINCFKKITYILSQIDGPQAEFIGNRALYKSVDANNYKWGEAAWYYGDWHIANRADPIQNALWTLVHNNSTITNEILTTGSSDAGASSSIYTAANGALNGKFELVLYVMKHTNQQSLIIVEKAEFTETVDVTLNFNKVKMDGTTKLNGAKISVNGVRNVASITNNLATTASNSGNLGSITVNPSDLSDNTFEIKIKETTTPSGYIGINETTLTVTYNTSTGAVTNVASNNTTYVPNRTNNTILIKNRPVVSLKFYKRDFGTTKLGGAEIEVTGYENTVSKFIGRNDNKTLINTDSKTLGTFETLTIYPSHENSYAKAKDGKATLKLKVEEIKAPTGYQKMPETVILTVTYDIYTGEVISITDENAQNNDSVYINPTSDGKNVIVRNQPVLSSLKIVKTDSLTPTMKIPGVTFILELENVDDISGYEIAAKEDEDNFPSLIYATTDSNGEINLNGIVLSPNKTQIKVKITEWAVPDKTADGYYYKVDKTPIEFTITYNNGSWSVTGGSTTGISISSDNAEISGSNASITIKNQPYITLSGMVWEDGQTGDKNAIPSDGVRYNESGIKDVKVYLCKADGTVTDYINKLTGNNNTYENGRYEFENVEKSNAGYKIKFLYNGIWYDDVGITNDIIMADGTVKYGSDAEENQITRESFNSRFTTITNGQSNDQTALTYTYEDQKSTLNANNAGNTTEVDADGKVIDTGDAKFQMSAQTGTYHTTTDNIDCGLVKKEFDLAIGTDVKTATLKINDKETTYNYDKILEGALTDIDIDKILQNNSSTSKEEIKYNLYLYTSDYNYRISDYKTGNEAIKNTVNPTDNTVNNYDNLKELEAYVTYSVTLKNQTTYNATVEEFVYYYDAIYEPQFEVNDVIGGYKVTSIENNKITFENNGENNALSETNSYRKEVNLTFKLDINSDAYKNLITTSREAKNAVEITKYSTDIGGLIDKDSAPGNGIANYEDDMDQAKGITISVGNKGTRTITGTVFEDTKAGENEQYNGQKDNSEQCVNDVIVQLIEIKKIGEQYYEYIWQETKSGSNIVKKLSANGNSIEEVPYRETVPNDGSYAFTDFVPGNYIIRFIYGDGTTYDITSDQYKDSADNVKKYNGQDYKSTIDSNYNKLWYNISTYSEGASVARDNEARRLEVMAYSSTIDVEKGKALAEKTALDKTWMAAETSRINVPVDADNTATDLSSTVVSYENIGNSVEFDTMNFGLSLRPETKLVLEKHITGLKITPNGVGVQPIVDARINIEEILGLVEESNIEGVTGVTTGLGTIKSDRDNRGFWKVETDIEELAQGAQLEVEYTYVLRNEGEKDYLSDTLVQAYQNQSVKTYNDTLKEIVNNTIKPSMRNGTYSYSDNNSIGKYLGQYYYNGNETNCVEVLSRVETIEEALNNKLVFEEADDFIKLNTDKVSRNVYDTDGNLVDNVGSGTKNIETVVRNTSASKFLTTGSADYSKTITLRTLLSSTGSGELGINLPSYIAEITSYSNAAGRRDMSIIPENLSYVHSDDTEITMSTHNEADEFWAESIIITKPTGEDKVAPIQIVIIAISSLAVIGEGIVLIKKFVLKK